MAFLQRNCLPWYCCRDPGYHGIWKGLVTIRVFEKKNWLPVIAKKFCFCRGNRPDFFCRFNFDFCLSFSETFLHTFLSSRDFPRTIPSWVTSYSPKDCPLTTTIRSPVEVRQLFRNNWSSKPSPLDSACPTVYDSVAETQNGPIWRRFVTMSCFGNNRFWQ